jgi:uncharacterized protein (DUF697 family)
MLGVPDLWRLIREADFESIRRDAERPFQILLVSSDVAQADKLGLLLSRADTRHPWLLPATPEEARRRAGAGLLDAAVVITPDPDLEPALATLRDVLGAARVPVVAVAVGFPAGPAALIRPGEVTRAAVAELGPTVVPTLAEALLAGVPPGVRLALARHLPPLRAPLFRQLIEETARANALYALTTGVAETVPVLNLPLNLADVIVLTKNQLVMSYRIALAAGKRGTARSVMGEVVGVIGGGFLFRQAGRQLVGLIPGAGVAPKVAVAYAGTHAIGRAVAAWADEGERLSAAAIKRFYTEAWERARAFARSLASEARTRPRRPRWLRRR